MLFRKQFKFIFVKSSIGGHGKALTESEDKFCRNFQLCMTDLPEILRHVDIVIHDLINKIVFTVWFPSMSFFHSDSTARNK